MEKSVKMGKGIKKMLKVAKELDWSVDIDGNEFTLGKYSPAGRDFNINITANNLEEAIKEIRGRCDDFDCSEETYVYLDNTGHGVSGAPYDMKDLYEDTEACLENMKELRDKLEEIEI